MADDYLGKKMEDYRRNAPAKAARRSSAPTYLRPGYVQVPFTPLTVAITDRGYGAWTCRAIVLELRAIDCRVALIGEPKLTKVAQETGCRFYPADTDSTLVSVYTDIEAHWGAIDMKIAVNPSEIEVTWSDNDLHKGGFVSIESSTPEAAGRLVRCLAELGDFRIFAPNCQIS